ncbi:MAG: aldose 1-epimerase family protein [Fusobacteriaceae bacterium]
MIQISNGFLTAEIEIKGAEVRKIWNNETMENYFWEPVPEIWNGVSPVLFPTVGKSINDEIRYNGKTYKLGNHGFARHTIFKVERAYKSEVTLLLTDEMLPKDSFMYQFEFRVKYSLVDKKLVTTYSVYNPMDEEIQFSVGAHPAIKCPFDENHKLSDYYIEFPKDEMLKQHFVNELALYTNETKEFVLKENKIDLAEIDVADTLVFSEYKSTYVELVEKDSDKKVKVSIEGFPYTAFWNKKGMNYICIEPWHGKSEDVDFKGEFSEKKDLVKLNGDKTWESSYTIEFNY